MRMPQIVHEFARGFTMRVTEAWEAEQLKRQRYFEIDPGNWMRAGWYEVEQVRPSRDSDGIPGDWDVLYEWQGLDEPAGARAHIAGCGLA